VLHEASDAHATEADFVDPFEAFAKVEGGSRFVLSAGLHDGARSARLAFEKAADKGGSEAAAELIRVNDQPVYVDRGSVEAPGDCSGEPSLNDRPEKGFAAGLEFFKRFPKRWNAFRANEVGLDSVSPPLQRKNCLRGFGIFDVEVNEFDHLFVRCVHAAASLVAISAGNCSGFLTLVPRGDRLPIPQASNAPTATIAAPTNTAGFMPLTNCWPPP
jgi:hypothetical protein